MGDRMEGPDKTDDGLLSKINSLQRDNVQSLTDFRKDIDSKLQNQTVIHTEKPIAELPSCDICHKMFSNSLRFPPPPSSHLHLAELGDPAPPSHPLANSFKHLSPDHSQLAISTNE